MEEISQKVRKTDRGEDERDIILRTERPAHVPPEAGRGHPDSPASAAAAPWGLGVSPGQQNNSACRRALGRRACLSREHRDQRLEATEISPLTGWRPEI